MRHSPSPGHIRALTRSGTLGSVTELAAMALHLWLHGTPTSLSQRVDVSCATLKVIVGSSTLSYFYPTLVEGLGYTANKAQYMVRRYKNAFYVCVTNVNLRLCLSMLWRSSVMRSQGISAINFNVIEA